MSIIYRSINKIADLLKNVSAITLFSLMVFITLAVIMRTFNRPILGDYFVIQLMMILLVMTGLPFTQKSKEHISIGLIVNRFKERTQVIFDIFAHFFTFIVCTFIGVVNFQNANILYSDNRVVRFLEIPVYPFVIVIGIGFLLWGSVALVQLVQSLNHVFRKR